jgi:hypothetical protein
MRESGTHPERKPDARTAIIVVLSAGVLLQIVGLGYAGWGAWKEANAAPADIATGDPLPGIDLEPVDIAISIPGIGATAPASLHSLVSESPCSILVLYRVGCPASRSAAQRWEGRTELKPGGPLGAGASGAPVIWVSILDHPDAAAEFLGPVHT